MTKEINLPEATEAQLIALDALWMHVIKSGLDARQIQAPAVVRVEGLPVDQAIVFVGSDVYEQLMLILAERQQVFADGLTETTLARASAHEEQEEGFAPSRF
jgi:hypothetical protein